MEGEWRRGCEHKGVTENRGCKWEEEEEGREQQARQEKTKIGYILNDHVEIESVKGIV